jgi:DUF1680 family protein
MDSRPLIGALVVCALLCGHVDAAGRKAPLSAVPFEDVHIKDAFWSPCIERNRTVTIEANLHQCEITGRVRNFAIVGGLESGRHQGYLFNDSDVYKMIEGIAYALSNQRDAALEKRVDAVIDKIAAAQQSDGYLNTYYTLVEPTKRWQNLAHGHELYCAGHLLEAAVAYYHSTGKRKLLDAACKYADYIATVFGPGKRIGVCGHEEIELALVKLYRTTHEKRYLDLAKFFLDMRGRGDLRPLYGEYAQDDKPIRQQTEASGHAVRAMYLYSAMADVASLTGDATLLSALDRIWHDVVDRKMYVTGGIGPSARNEGFTIPYDLPNDTAYAETCAAIGMALWNHRMFLLSRDGKYADVLEREVYNGLLSGVSLPGDRFFYDNPLGSKGTHHRVPWFDCSCCPTNIVRYLPALGERVYAKRDNGIWTVLYIGNTATRTLKGGTVKLTEETKYPWEGRMRFTVDPEQPFLFDFNLRIPGWCDGEWTVSLNGERLAKATPVHGYVRISRTWKRGDVVTFDLPMRVRKTHADPHVRADRGRIALQRGPILFCLEGVDNPQGHVRNLCLPQNAEPAANFESALLGGVVTVSGTALAVSRDEHRKLVSRPVRFKAVPYATWDNRQPGEMAVWIPEDPELAEIPGEEGVLFGRRAHPRVTRLPRR